jgi:hypothetical protein
MEAKYAKSVLDIETPRQDRTADVLARQPALVTRTNRATRLYEEIEARLMGLSISSLGPGQKSPPSPWLSGGGSRGWPGRGRSALKCSAYPRGVRHAIIRGANAGDGAAGWPQYLQCDHPLICIVCDEERFCSQCDRARLTGAEAVL